MAETEQEPAQHEWVYTFVRRWTVCGRCGSVIYDAWQAAATTQRRDEVLAGPCRPELGPIYYTPETEDALAAAQAALRHS